MTCPCGGSSYAACCGPLLDNARLAATPEQLMRSRYTANVVGHHDHLFRTWHPRTRPADVRAVPGWTSLRIVAAPDLNDDTGVVEFLASHPVGDLHEVSRFERRRGRWLYVDGDVS